MKTTGVICGGSWLVDKTKIIDRWPVEETVAVIEQATMQAGGPGMNLGINLKRLGAAFPVYGVGVLGDDVEGKFLRAVCRRNSVDNKGLRVVPSGQTSYTDVFTSAQTGKRTFFHFEGVNAQLSPDDFDFTTMMASHLHIGAPGIHATMDGPSNDDENGWVTVLKKARQAGLATNMEFISLQPERLAKLARPCLPLLDTLIVNDVEIGAITGIHTVTDGATDVAAVIKAATTAQELGVRQFVVVHFPLGSVVVGPGRAPHIAGSVHLPEKYVVSSVGAGDAFASGLLFGLLHDESLDACVALAHAAATVCLGSVSTNEALIPAKDCLEHARELGYRQPPA
ncbi:carbohydrate kinase family protein [Desulfovibrio inopinatus]|uniref:carbohydrate kinase family protein n=1 Tax=Desulfovibrio inopinatus TaxID=102109 RepID=UPI0003F885B4|nr:carbohydrate kinase family protein [Desulfovibrio inopinatus]